MSVINVSGITGQIAVGLLWEILPKATTRKSEIAAVVKEHGSSIGCLVHDEKLGATMVGLAGDGKGLISGAAWLAHASFQKPIILAEPVGADQVWICAVRTGLPVPGADLLVPANRAIDELNKIIQQGGQSATAICSTIDAVANEFGNVDNRSFAELVRSAGDVPKDSKLRRLAGTNPLIVIVGVVAAAAIFGAPKIQAYMAELKQRESLAKLEEIRAQQRQANEASQAADRQLQLKRFDQAVSNAVLSRPSPEAMVAAMFATLEPLPLVLGGYALTAFDCTAQPVCTVTWKRSPGGTVLTLADAAEARGFKVLSASKDFATTEHEVKVEGREGEVNSIASRQVFLAALEAKLQGLSDLGMQYDVKADGTHASAGAASAALSTGAASAPALESPWHLATFSVSGSTLVQSKLTAGAVTHPAIALKSLQGDMTKKNWKMEFNYATK